MPWIAWWMGCGGGQLDVETEPTPTPTPSTEVEIVGDGIDEDRDGWLDEYGVPAEPASGVPRELGDFVAVDAGEVAGRGWIVAARPSASGPGEVVSWSEPLYAGAAIAEPYPAEAPFGATVAVLEGYVAVTADGATPGVDLFGLPASTPYFRIDTAGTPTFAAARGDADQPAVLLVSDGVDTQVWEGPFAYPSLVRTVVGASGAPGGSAEVTGDGVAELLLSDGTAGLVLDGATIGDVSVDAAWHVDGEESWAPVGVGDVDGDGYGDLAVATPTWSEGRGSVALVFGPVDGSIDVAGAAVRLDGVWPGEACARVVRVEEALAIGCEGGSLPGRIAVFAVGRLTGPWSVDAADRTFVGTESDQGVGGALAGGVDLTGDDTPDLVTLAGGAALIAGPLVRD
jgi:hypothetical protein